MDYKIEVYLGNFNVCIFKEDETLFIYLYSGYMFCVLQVDESVKVRPGLNNYLVVENRDVNTSGLCIASAEFVVNFLEQFKYYKNVKVRLAGKGYKLKRSSKNSANLMFNKAHITYVWWRNLNTQKLRKVKMYLVGLYNPVLLSKVMVGVRGVNIFTKRGLRISRQLLLKKKGKK